MKHKNKHRYLLLGLMMAFLSSVVMLSCKNDDPTLEDLRNDKVAFIADSLRISDSLRRINSAGVVNYSVTVVDGSTSSIFAQGKTNNAIDQVIVTISQFGKILKDTTGVDGIAVFNGLFRSAVNVSIEKAGFTKVEYVAQVNYSKGAQTDSNGNLLPGEIAFAGNIIPLFALTGNTTSTISGVATIQSNLTNKTRENVPDGTTLSVAIDASANSDFSDKFLTRSIEFDATAGSCGCQFVNVGRILQASYQTGVVGTITNGAYTVTVPAAVDGLPLMFEYSDVATTQTLFESTGADGQRTITNRTVFRGSPFFGPASLPASGSVTVSFESFETQAAGTAVITNGNGSLDRINVTAAGSGYTSAPVIDIVGGGGTGATATATVAGGQVTGITLTNAGTGYTAAPAIVIKAGSGATASTALAADGTVTAIQIVNSGAGYTAAPTVSISAPGGTGVTATATASIDAAGRVTGFTITNFGSGYTGNPTVTLTAPPAGGTQATANGIFSGNSVSAVTIVSAGTNYAVAPTVVFSAPQRNNGVRATGTAAIDASTGQVIGISVTNAGSGYTAAPTITISSATGAAATAVLAGGQVSQVLMSNNGSRYVGAPVVQFAGGGGSGAAGTANYDAVTGKITGVTITNAGAGYTSAPTVTFVSGDNANAFATITNGAITAVTITDGGRNFVGAPRVIFTSTSGAGATATTTTANGAITAVNVTAGGSGYLEGNVPSTPEAFSASRSFNIDTKPGVKYVNDLHYGTGTVRNPN